MDQKIISFDADGTLVKRNLIDKFWFEEIPKLYAKYHNVPFDGALELVKKNYEEIGPEDIRWYLPEYWFDRFSFEETPSEVIGGLKSEVVLFQDGLDVLGELYGKYPLIVTSNASQEFLKVELEKVRNYFTDVYSSTSDFRRVKKDTRFYRELCDDIKIKPEKLIHVGDDQEADYLFPKQIGIRSVLINREELDGKKDVLNDLRDLINLI